MSGFTLLRCRAGRQWEKPPCRVQCGAAGTVTVPALPSCLRNPVADGGPRSSQRIGLSPLFLGKRLNGGRAVEQVEHGRRHARGRARATGPRTTRKKGTLWPCVAGVKGWLMDVRVCVCDYMWTSTCTELYCKYEDSGSRM